MSAGREPIAMVGMACRFPGAGGVEDFWRLLREGRSAVDEVGDRRVGLSVDPALEHGGLLDDVDRFDADFFRISPREAERMDPQQRLLLEVAWHAFEDAGLPPARFAGRPVGVFVGISGSGYSLPEIAGADSPEPEQLTGTLCSIAPNRLSYFFDFRGPSLAVDTACSSSLVAVHLACQSLWQGDAELALTAGSNLILESFVSRALRRTGVLASDGRSKTFDAAADGYVRGEGVAAVVLRPLAEARRAGDRIYALIRASAVNQDGATNGLTAPNGGAQEAVIRQALARAGVAPAEVDYVEAHGTGTLLGDPIEAKALGRVLADQRPAARPCALGSVKTNIGHLEAAAGIAGLIKVALMLHHRELVPSLHFEKPNPYIPFERLRLRVQQVCEPWSGERPRIAGVSSFGIGGTNAHTVLEQAPPVPAAAHKPRAGPYLLALSAHSASALRRLAGRYAERLAGGDRGELEDLCFGAATGRSHLRHRLCLLVRDPQHAGDELRAFAGGSEDDPPPSAHLLHGECKSSRSACIAFLFTGQDSLYPGMGKVLYERQEVFRRHLDRCAEILAPELDRPLSEVLDPPAGSTAGNATVYVQPSLFALEYALAEQWRAWGITPSLVLGHSVGEYVAAAVAGVFSLEDGLRLVAARGRLMQALPAAGGMAAVAAGEEHVHEVIAGHSDALSIAAVNAPDQVVLSGEQTALEAATAQLRRQGVKCRALEVSHAFHSPLMAPIRDGFLEAAATVRFHRPRVELISSLTGRRAGEEITTPEYWLRHVLGTVRFAAGMETLRTAGCDAFVELGPAPVLLALGRRCLEGTATAWLPSLDPEEDDAVQLATSLAELYCRGASVDWPACYGGGNHRRPALPSYPFKRQRHWRRRTGSAPPRHSASSPPPSISELLDLVETLDDEEVAAIHERIAALPPPRRELLALLGGAGRSPAPDAAVGAATPPSEEALVRGRIARLTALRPEGVDLDLSLAELGLSSLRQIQLWQELAAAHPELTEHGFALSPETTGRDLLMLLAGTDPAAEAAAGEPVPPACLDREAMSRQSRHPGDAVIGELLVDPAGETISAPLVVDQTDPFFFDHPYDHVPGVLFVEAVRQLAAALAPGLYPRGPAAGYCVVSLRMDFERWGDVDARLRVRARRIERRRSGFTVAGDVAEQGEPDPCVGFAAALVPAPAGPGPAATPGDRPGDALAAELVHKVDPTNVLIGPVVQDGPVSKSAALVPPPGHAVAPEARSATTAAYTATYLLEVARQFATGRAHLLAGQTMDRRFLFLSARLELRRPIPFGAPLELRADSGRGSGANAVEVAEDRVAFVVRGREVGEVLLLGATAAEEDYARARWGTRQPAAAGNRVI
ncbi:MAG: acyltransferase domain-containing protein [bacterium]|nr:acyltransferase domain-containing protein [bacterium]